MMYSVRKPIPLTKYLIRSPSLIARETKRNNISIGVRCVLGGVCSVLNENSNFTWSHPIKKNVVKVAQRTVRSRSKQQKYEINQLRVRSKTYLNLGITTLMYLVSFEEFTNTVDNLCEMLISNEHQRKQTEWQRNTKNLKLRKYKEAPYQSIRVILFRFVQMCCAGSLNNLVPVDLQAHHLIHFYPYKS